MMFLVAVSAQLSSKSYQTHFDEQRVETSSPGTAARVGINAVKKQIARKRVDYWNVKIVPIRGL